MSNRIEPLPFEPLVVKLGLTARGPGVAVGEGEGRRDLTILRGDYFLRHCLPGDDRPRRCGESKRRSPKVQSHMLFLAQPMAIDSFLPWILLIQRGSDHVVHS